MCRPSVAINAAMLAAAVGIDARGKAHVGTVVVSDDRAGVVLEELGGRSRSLRIGLLRVGLVMNLFESIGGIVGRATAVDWLLITFHDATVAHARGAGSRRA